MTTEKETEEIGMQSGIFADHREFLTTFTSASRIPMEELAKMNGFIPIRLACNAFVPSSDVAESAAPVVFLHGLTSCKETWGTVPQAIANATGRKTYAVDFRNHGDSEWHDSFLLDDLLGDLIFFVDAIRAEKVIIIGHSMGGTVGIHMALRMPERVEALIVEDMFVKMPPKKLIAIPLAYTQIAPMAVRLLPADISEDQAAQFITDYMGQALPRELAEFHRLSRFDRSTMSLKRGTNGRFQLKANMPVLERSLLNPDEALEDLRGQFRGHACFVYGKMSPFQVDKEVDHIKQYFPAALLLGIEGAKHSVHTDQPEEYVTSVLKFISGCTNKVTKFNIITNLLRRVYCIKSKH